MPKTKISEYSTTNSDNTDIESINIAEGCAPSGINNAIRELMVHLKEFQTGSSGDPLTVAGAFVASAGVTANTLTLTGILTASGGTILSSTNTLSGSNIISGNINSSGTTNTFSGGNIFSGTNTISGSAIISGNINSSGTNTFSGSNVMSFGSGTSASPSIYFASDTNTGIFSPAADTIAFAEGGAEAMRIDSDGDVGIGTTAPSDKLHVAAAAGSGSGDIGLKLVNTTTADKLIRLLCTGPTYSYAGIGGSQAAIYTYANNLTMCVDGAGAFTVATNGSERARITSDGELWVARTTDAGAYNIQCGGTGVWGAGAYVNGSDARIKEDIAPIATGLEVVNKLNPVTYRYKQDWSKDQSTQTGFIAQELLTALDGKNYVDGIVQQGGAEGYYSVAYQNIIPILTKAIQELNAKVDAQTTRIEALEAEVAALKGQ